ncbi:MAG: cbb3-type cytochrome c oxidase subunit II, partial [Planctomycetota bacterium]
EKSIMPAYGWLYERDTDYAGLEAKLEALSALGTPYEDELGRAEELARAQAEELHAALALEDPSAAEHFGDPHKQVFALIAYLRRLGTDINKPNPYTKAAVTASAGELNQEGAGGTR